MREEIWIDGFNLFYKWSETKDLFGLGVADMGRSQNIALKSLADALGRKWRSHVTVFMDGGLRCESLVAFGMRVRYGGPGVKADNMMMEAVNGRRGKVGNIDAISSDRGLAANLKSCNTNVIPVEDFINEVLSNKPSGRAKGLSKAYKHKKLSGDEVEAWLEIFEDEEGQE